MTKVNLTDEELRELENIINCLKSTDLETFNLGKALLQSTFPEKFSVPMNDIYIPFESYWHNLLLYHSLSLSYKRTLRKSSLAAICILLKNIIINKYYVIT